MTDDEAMRRLEAAGAVEPDIDGAQLLDSLAAIFRRYVVFPSPACCVAATLWTAHALALEAFESTPRLAYISPEKGSGKTRALEVHEGLVLTPCTR